MHTHKLTAVMNHIKIIFVACLLFGYLTADIYGDDYSNDEPPSDDYEYEYDDVTSKSGSKESEIIPVENTKPQSVAHAEQTELKVDARLGENVILNCDVSNLPNATASGVVMWYKNTTLITSGEYSINHRVELLQNKSILIRSVELEDAGDYYCNVLPGDTRLHIALILSDRLAIYCDGKEVTNRSVLFRQGESHVLECRANSANESDIKWSFNGQRAVNVVSQVDGSKMYFDIIDEEHGGIYQCLGDDGSSEPPHGMVTVDVLYSPKVSTHRHRVNTEAGGTAELYCDYKAHPAAVVHWLKSGSRLATTEKYAFNDTTHKNRNRTILTVKDISSADLVEYGCQVENNVGSNKVNIHIIYEPEIPQFEDIKIDGDKVTLRWLVRSVQPLSEAVLDYKMTGAHTWSTVAIVHTKRNPVNKDMWKVTHEMSLVPGVWHTRMKAKNTVGWSKFSDQYDFTITEDGDDTNPNSDQLPPDDIVMVAGIGGSKPKNNASACLHVIPSVMISLLVLLRLQLKCY